MTASSQLLRPFAMAAGAALPVDVAILGGKGANLVRMADMGLPVPPGFILTTPNCAAYEAAGNALPLELWDAVCLSITDLETASGRTFGKGARRLLVSVRSGAPVSMPGMMDTVLNLGLTQEGTEALAQETGDARFAWDCYRRFIQMYANVVSGLDLHPFEAMLQAAMESAGVSSESDLPAEALQTLASAFRDHVRVQTEEPFPDEAFAQLRGAIGAVFESWHGHRAKVYRSLNGISEDMGTAVVVQRMVFGNLGQTSASGVLFTRDPSTGAAGVMGEYLVNAQGEDVVAGIRTPDAIEGGSRPMARVLPGAYAHLIRTARHLEQQFCDMQDIEFTVEEGQLWMLQTRAGKRSARATVECAVAFAEEGLISRPDALQRVTPAELEACLHPQIQPGQDAARLALGLAASPGAAVGRIALTSERAKAYGGEGTPTILVRAETSPEDIEGMHVSAGILTATGGQTSHAAVVARGMGRPCVCGVAELSVSADAAILNGTTFREGDWITIDGSSGEVFEGRLQMVAAKPSAALHRLLNWADATRDLKVRANAETGEDALRARQLGAEGIGLVRTEHMFFSEDGIFAMRQMILAETEEDRAAGLARLEPIQVEGFVEVFRAMSGLPVTVRLLDPPLHEFLPRTPEDFSRLSAAIATPEQTLHQRAEQMAELNPMIGHRGCRLAICYPGLVQMQVRAMACAIDLMLKDGLTPPDLEIMVPLVGARAELVHVADLIRAELDKVSSDLTYSIGTMIELPSAALTADQVAQDASFFSFGTNDLTQTTLGISRDDAGHFMQVYRDKGIFGTDPFATLDIEAVGKLIALAAKAGRAARPGLKLGACGEHAGDPASIAFFAQVGLDYISCSPMRLPVARLAAAQAALERTAKKKREAAAQRVA